MTTAERLAVVEAKIDEVLAAVQGKPGMPTLVERVQATETEIQGLKTRERWGMAKSLALTILAAIASTMGLKATVGL